MRSLAFKITLSFLVVSLAGIGLAAALLWGVTSISFNRFMLEQRQAEFAATAASFYERTGSWDGVVIELQQRNLIPPPVIPGSSQIPQPQPFALADRNGFVIVGGGPFRHGDVVPRERLESGTIIEIDGQVVGVVVTTGQIPTPTPIEQLYQTRVNQALLAAALCGTLVALILGFIIPRSLTRPIRELTKATHAMAGGQLGQKVSVRSLDELGELATAFNQMNTALANATESRLQMTADIAHELRNPLTVIGGYLESMRDGVLKPDRKRIETIYGEVQHLQALVEDLRTLSLADSGGLQLNVETVDVERFLEGVLKAYAHLAKQKGLKIRLEKGSQLPDIEMDPGRMQQVMGNLIVNAINNSPKGSPIILAARKCDDRMAITVRDGGRGINEKDLPHVFERFYRADESRQGTGSGLGLAIVKALVELHGGRVAGVNNADGPGCTFTVALPLDAG